MKEDAERMLAKVSMAVQITHLRIPFGEKWGAEFILEVGLADIVGGAIAIGLSKEELQARVAEMFDKGIEAIGAEAAEIMKQMRVKRAAERS